MNMIYFKNFRMHFLLALITMVIACQALLAADQIEFKTGPQAASKFWSAREQYNVQLASIHDCTKEQAQSEIKRLVNLAATKNINLLSYPLFATKVSNEDWGYCAVGIFYTQAEAQTLASKLSFLDTSPIVRQPATTLPQLSFVIYRDPK